MGKHKKLSKQSNFVRLICGRMTYSQVGMESLITIYIYIIKCVNIYRILILNISWQYKVFKYYICLTSVMHVKCGVRSTLCWKIANISGSTKLFGLQF